MTDLTTLLSFFLKDLYAGTLGTTAPVTGIQLTAAGTYSWLGRSIWTSPADGVVEVTNNAGTGFTRAIFGTNDNGAGGFGLVNNGGGLDVKSGDGTAFRNVSMAGLTTSTTAVIGTKISSYNAVATAGWGVPAVQAQATVGPITNNGSTSIATYTPGASDGIFRVSADVLVTTSSNHTFSIDCVYTDANNSARTLILPMTLAGGTGTFLTNGLITNTLGVGAYSSASIEIRAKASTSITLRTSAGGTFTGVVYTASGSITQVG